MGTHKKQLQIGGAHIIFFKMTDHFFLFIYLFFFGGGGGGIFVQVIGGTGAIGGHGPRAPPPYSYGPVFLPILKDFENASPRLNPLFHKP